MLNNSSYQWNSVPKNVVIHTDWIVWWTSMTRQINAQYWNGSRQQRHKSIECAGIVLPTVQRNQRLLVFIAVPFAGNVTPRNWNFNFFETAIFTLRYSICLIRKENKRNLKFCILSVFWTWNRPILSQKRAVIPTIYRTVQRVPR